MRLLPLGCAVLLAGCAYAPPPPLERIAGRSAAAPEWHNVSAETGDVRDVGRLEELVRAFPDSSSVRLRMLQAHFAAEDFAATVGDAIWLARRGYVFSDGAQQQLIDLAGDTAIAEQLKTLMTRNNAAKTASEIAAIVPVEAQLVESVAVEPRSGSLFVSTVVSRQIYGQYSGKSWLSFDVGAVNSLSGLAFDPMGKYLWATAGDLGMTPADAELANGIVRIVPQGRFESVVFPAPKGVQLSDLTVADFAIFASDPIGGGIYKLEKGANSIATLIEPGTFRSPQGLAKDEQSQRLYISDYRYGIGIVDLATGKVTRLRADSPMILDGIDGLWKYGNHLIGVQNGMNPMRIVSITLSSDGYSAVDLTVLEQSHPDWTEPLGGAIHNGALYYVATGQWDRFAAGGAPKSGKPAAPTQLRRLPL